MSNKINLNQPILLVDLGFALFYRFYATQIWYRKAHPEEKIPKDYLWHTNKEYLEKYQKTFFSDLEKIAKRYKIPHNNIIIAEDCRRKNIWRTKVYPEYKLTRSESHRKNGFNGAEVFQHVVDIVIPTYIEKHGIKCFKHKEAEADDVVAIIAQHMTENYPNQKIVIVAKDTDYFQLLDKNENITMVDMKARVIEHIKNPLWRKILGGDISDNIPACKFRQDLIYELVYQKPVKESYKNKHIKANKKILDYYTINPKQLTQDLEKYPDYILDQCYQLNQQLIDFTHIPQSIRDEVTKLFLNDAEEGEIPFKKVSPKKKYKKTKVT